jgi:lactoylglutathione lyase
MNAEDSTVVRFGQPNLYTSDIDAMSAFYQLLGFTESYRFPTDGPPAFAALQRGTFFINLSVFDDVRRSSGLPRIGPTRNHQMDLVVIVEDVDDTLDALRGSVTVVVEPKNQPWGERHAYVADPEGNYVQITTHSDHW